MLLIMQGLLVQWSSKISLPTGFRVFRLTETSSASSRTKFMYSSKP